MSLDPLAPSDADAAVRRLYARLRELARRLLGERRGPRRLDPTEVVHECYLRLARLTSVEDRGDQAFVALAAATMRSVLVDLARREQRAKRGGGWGRITLNEAAHVTDGDEVDLLALDDALGRLAELHPRQARVVELRFFGGLEGEDIAGLLEVPARTVSQDWAMARAWLRQQLVPSS